MNRGPEKASSPRPSPPEEARARAFEFQITRRVEFCDTDLAGIMHFSNFFRFMEAAETAFLRSLGLSVLLSRCGLEVCLPRVHAECDYRAPLQFEDEVLIHLLVERKGTGSLTYQFRFCRADDHIQEVARGRLVLACASRQENGSLKPVPLPKALADKIQQAPAQILAESWRPSRVERASAALSKNGHPIKLTASITNKRRSRRTTREGLPQAL
jgi:acyl-CoA thioester hydrolase